MQKETVRLAYYEHRFGLFFFGIFLLFGFVMLDSMRIVEDHGVAYSFYCVDFSIGFCTKILPGAIYNFLFGKYTETAITIYVKSLIILVFLAIAFLFEAILKNSKSDVRKERFFFLCFAAATICYFFFKAGLVYLLDFHWIIAALLFIICISNKRLYIFIPLTFLYAILTHYVSLICYVAICLIIVFYKAYKAEKKKEKYFLYAVLVVSVALVGGMFLYMLLFELYNLKISYPQFVNLLESRGVEQVEYYKFAFIRDSVEDVFESYFNEETKGLIENIDMNQSPIKILIDTVYQQLKINLYLADHKKICRSCLFSCRA